MKVSPFAKLRHLMAAILRKLRIGDHRVRDGIYDSDPNFRRPLRRGLRASIKQASRNAQITNATVPDTEVSFSANSLC
jgi:hypothetical protein